MKKVFFVSPNETSFLENAGDRMPLGALYVATSAKRAGYDVKFFDLNHNEEENFLYKVYEEKPDVIGYSAISSPSFKYINNLISLAKTYSNKSISVVGGYHAIARPQDFEFADFVIRGDGESAIHNVLEGLTIGKGIYRVDINDIPFPDRSLVNTNNYDMQQNGHRTATLISSRGCPFNCVFCGNYDRKVRLRNPDNIAGELEQLLDMGFQSLYFLDDAFTINKKHAKEISDVVNDYAFPFRITTRADLLGDGIVEYMVIRGLEIVSIGIESGNDKILENANKHMTTDDNRKAVKLLHQYGVDVKGFFIFGLPGEGPKEAQQTIDFARELKKEGLTSADFYAMTPFPGAPIYEHPEKYGCKILSHDWDKYLEVGKDEIEPVMETNTLSAEQIKYFMRKAKKEWKK